MPTVTLLPASTNPTGEARFAWYQFNKRPKAIYAIQHRDGEWESPGISFADFDRFKLVKRPLDWKQGPPPRWFADQELFRDVLLKYIERRYYAFGRGDRYRPLETASLPERIANIKSLVIDSILPLRFKLLRLEKELAEAVADGESDKRIARLCSLIQGVDSEICIAERGPLAIIAAVVYLSYAMNWTSVGVAEELGLRPPFVRQVLNRMNRTWRMMTGEQRVSRYTDGGMMFGKILPPWDKEKLERLRTMRALNIPHWRCARAFGVSNASVRFACHHYIEDPCPGHRAAVRWTPEKLEQARQLREFGKTFKEVAEIMKLKYASTVSMALKNYGVTVQGARKR
jgi:hypothetical protein